MQNAVNTATNNKTFGLQAGLASSIPVIIWCLLQSRLYPDASPWAQTLTEAMQALWILQAIAIVIVLPWHACRCQWQNCLLQSVTLICIPLPVYNISLLSNAYSINALLSGFGLLALLAIALIASIKLMDRFVAGTQTRTLSRATVQLGGAILIWTYRDLWLSAILN